MSPPSIEPGSKALQAVMIPLRYARWHGRGNKYFFWSIFVSMPEEARRGPKKLRFIFSNQKEVRTRAEKWDGMFSLF